jgi:TolA-binding protein
MLLRLLVTTFTLLVLYVGTPQASDNPGLESLQKRLMLLEKEILDLKMKNVVEDKFEWQFLKMTEIENDIKRLHNRFEILENNYYKELKNLKSSIMKSDKENRKKIENFNERNQKKNLSMPSTDSSGSLESLELIGREDELFMNALKLFDNGKTKLAEKRFTEFIEGFPTSAKLSSALFWRAEARVKIENWIGAANDYLESFTVNPDGVSAAKTLFGLGVSLGAIGEKDQACLTLDEVGSRFKNIEKTLLTEIVKAKSLLDCDQPR